MYSLQYIVYMVQCIVYNVQCTWYSVNCTVYIVHCTVVQFTWYSVLQCTLYSVHCTVYTVTKAHSNEWWTHYTRRATHDYITVTNLVLRVLTSSQTEDPK